VDDVFYLILYICIALLVIITVLMVYFAVRYNRRRNPTAAAIDGNIPMEIVWTVAPTILVLGMFYYGWTGFVFMRSVPPNALVVKVNARMWEWSFHYGNGKESSTLVAPLGKPVLLLLYSRDVIHSLYIPAFRIKEDAVPGRENYLWFEARKKGTYDILCAQYCGLKHSDMLARVIIVEQGEYEQWLASKEDSLPHDTMGVSFKLMADRGCLKCHSSDGTELSAPTFKGLFGRKRKVSTGGQGREAVADEAYLRAAILSPGADIVDGYKDMMPRPGREQTEQDTEMMIEYIRNLK
jgi:cytochrome c oxidase subunit II